MSIPPILPLQHFQAYQPSLSLTAVTTTNINNPIRKVETRRDPLTGTYFILWRDVITLYPNAKRVMDSNTLVSFMVGGDLEELTPPRIRYYPGKVLSVVLTSIPPVSADPAGSPVPLEISVDENQNPPRPSVADTVLEPTVKTEHTVADLGISDRDQKVTHPLPNSSPLVSRNPTDAEDARFLIPSIYPHTKTWFSARTPRLFILLPSTAAAAEGLCLSSYPQRSPYSTKLTSANQLRLYFFCESFEGYTVPKKDHWVHLAQQAGYRIAQPTLFLKEFGNYILAVMEAVRTGFAQSSRLGNLCTPAAKMAREMNKLEKVEINLWKSHNLWSIGTNVDVYTEENVTAMLDATIVYLKSMARGHSALWRDLGRSDKTSWREGEGIWDHIDMNLKQYIPKTTVRVKHYGDLYKTLRNDGYCQMVCQTHSHRQLDSDNLNGLIVDSDQYIRCFWNGLPTPNFEQRENTAIALGEDHFSDHLSFISLDFSLPAQSMFDSLPRIRTLSELSLGLNWDINAKDLERFAAGIIQSSVISLCLYATVPRSVTAIASPEGISTPMNSYLARQHDPLLRMLAKGKLQRFLFRGLPDLFWSINQQESAETKHQWSLLRGLSDLLWVRCEDLQSESFPTLLSADFRTIKVNSRILRKFHALRILKMDFSHQVIAQGSMVTCLAACPTLEEVEVYFSGAHTVRTYLLADVDSVLRLAPQWKEEGRSRLRSYRSIAPDGYLYLDFVSKESKEMSPRISFSLYGEGYLQPLLGDVLKGYGWAMKVLNLSRSWERLDLKTWHQSIKDKQGMETAVYLEELHLPRVPLDYYGRYLLRPILIQSPHLRSLTAPVTCSRGEQLPGHAKYEYLEWVIRDLGHWLTDLWLCDCPGWNPSAMTVIPLKKPILAKLTSLLVKFNPQEHVYGHDWLADVIASNREYFASVQLCPSVDPLQSITLHGVNFKTQSQDPWKKILEAIDFSSMQSLVIAKSTFDQKHWNTMLDCLPPQGLLPDGSPVPLRSLTLKHTLLRENSKETKLKQEQLCKKAPLAELTIV
ncbi:hypothetical protein EMPS_08616 [Entomortierella parvispora]|uniref:Uncharacterized protein n=1 Tax=Entomortierella parvispora TaxID=205924 RepID=A0A9P3HGM1_9FUNG|nr:hypothetical protein EMPS_08616 [Entomortierella parvispora]